MSEKKKKKPEKKGISTKLRRSVSSIALPTEDISGMIKDLEDGLSYFRHCKKMPDDVQKNFNEALKFFCNKFEVHK